MELSVNQAIEKMNGKNVQSWGIYSEMEEDGETFPISFTGGEHPITVDELVEALTSFDFLTRPVLVIEFKNEHEERYFINTPNHA